MLSDVFYFVDKLTVMNSCEARSCDVERKTRHSNSTKKFLSPRQSDEHDAANFDVLFLMSAIAEGSE